MLTKRQKQIMIDYYLVEASLKSILESDLLHGVPRKDIEFFLQEMVDVLTSSVSNGVL